MGESYEAAGVNVAAGERAVELIKASVRSTYRREVIGDVGGFGSLFALETSRWRDPVMVASTDGVGTKALVAKAAGRFDSIGIDLVAMCVDDLVCQGAEPLFFLDYIAVGHLDPDHIGELVEGMAQGCRQAGCALIGGEMAEHPGAMEPGDFDIVGFAVGVVERDEVITGRHVAPGDALIGLHSPGLRSNGYSLVRRTLLERAGRGLDEPAFDGSHRTLADELLEPSVIYAPAVARLRDDVDVRALAHITGGGIPGNLPRVLPPTVDAVVRLETWETPPIFTEIARVGEVSAEEMLRVFNMGIGMIAVVPPTEAHAALDSLRGAGVAATEIGEVVPGSGQVLLPRTA